jgi:hypothetical protein
MKTIKIKKNTMQSKVKRKHSKKSKKVMEFSPKKE